MEGYYSTATARDNPPGASGIGLATAERLAVARGRRDCAQRAVLRRARLLCPAYPRRDPYHPPRFWNHLGRAYFVARRYTEAIEAFKRIAAPDQFHHAFLAACHAQAGNEEAARDHAREVLKRNAGFTFGGTVAPVLHYKCESDLAHHRDSVRNAGLPA